MESISPPEKKGGVAMIYRCTDPECSCVLEQAERPECCPDCGHTMEPAAEAALTGKDWTQLGNWWIEGPRRSDLRAYACFRRAAGMGDPCGISNLGWCLENGVGVEADLRQAAWLYEQAAELDHVPAMCNFGWCLQNGAGVGRDPVRAAEWYQLAAERTFPRAQILLSRCYRDGVGVERDEEKAVYWLKAAAFQGDPAGQSELGRRYEFGEGVKRYSGDRCALVPQLGRAGASGRHVLPGGVL